MVNILDFREKLKILINTLIREVGNYESQFVRMLSYLETPNAFAAHSLNTAIFAFILSQHLEINSQAMHKVLAAAFLHDIGKLEYPIRVKEIVIYHKENPEDIIKNHPTWGSRVLSVHLKADPEVANMVVNHHEKNDGSGFPRGLISEQLTLQDNIVFTANLIDNVLKKTHYSGFDSLAKTIECLLVSRKGVFQTSVRNILNEIFDLKKEGRRHKRYRINARGVVHNSTNDVIIPCSVMDISSGGIKISVEEPLNEFYVFKINSKITTNLHIRDKICRITWNKKDRSNYQYGLKFETSSDEIIASLIEQL